MPYSHHLRTLWQTRLSTSKTGTAQSIDSKGIIMAVWDKKVLFATALIVYTLSVLLHKHFKCNLASVVDKLCSAYKAGHVSGPLCPDLCSSQSIFHLGNCLSTVPDKKIYNGEWQGEKVIFKINMSWFEEFEKRQKIADISVVSSYQEDVSSRV